MPSHFTHPLRFTCVEFGHLPAEALTLAVLLLVVFGRHVKTQLQLLHLPLQLGLCL